MDGSNRVRCLDFLWDEIMDARGKGELLSMDIELSKLCNLRCIYCYAGSGRKSQNELSLDEIFSVIDQAIKLGLKKIAIIGGGEPLLYPQYWDLVQYINETGLPSITITNGTCIDEETAERLFAAKQDIALKFNSFDENKQDYLAGGIKGTGRKIKNALEFLLKVGYSSSDSSPRLALETIICKSNIDEIQKIYIFCRENNIIPFIEILSIQGYAKQQADQLAVTPEECRSLFEYLQEYDKKTWGISWPLVPPVIGQICNRMYYSAYLTATGEIQPCGGVNISGGNIRDKSLKEILHESDIFKTVRNIDKNIKESCKSCEYGKEVMCYGCRGKALQHTGDVLKGDTTCWWNNDSKTCKSI